MKNIINFVEEYENLKQLFPDVYVNINESRRGNFWRIGVYAYEMAIIGDAELLNVEHEDKDTAFAIATQKLKDLPSRIYGLMEEKKLNKQIYRKER